MGFKWFKARITMNRVSTNPGAVAGSYRSTVFDSPNNEFSTYNQTTNGYTKPDQELGSKAVSMPNLNNPMVGISDKDKRFDFVPSTKTETGQRKFTAKTRSEIELSGRDGYAGLVTGNSVPLNTDTAQRDFKANIGISTPRPVPKMNKVEYKKKKAKAPAPKMKLSTGSTSTLESGSGEFIILRNDRKSSQASDINV